MCTLLCNFDCFVTLPEQAPQRLLYRSILLPAVPLQEASSAAAAAAEKEDRPLNPAAIRWLNTFREPSTTSNAVGNEQPSNCEPGLGIPALRPVTTATIGIQTDDCPSETEEDSGAAARDAETASAAQRIAL